MNIDEIIQLILPKSNIIHNEENNKIAVTDVDNVGAIKELFVSRCEKGFFVKLNLSSPSKAFYKLNKDTIKYIIKGEDREFRKKILVYKMFIPDKGIPVFTTRGKRLYLSPSNIFTIINNCNGITPNVLREILKYSCPHQEWWLGLATASLNYRLKGNPYNIPLDIIRKCSNLQQYINKINYTGVTASAQWFKDMYIGDITYLIAAGNYLHNPTDLWNDGKITSNFIDTLKMAAQINRKFTYSGEEKAMMVQHDNIMKQYLDNAEPVPLKVGRVFYDFKYMFPDYHLIEDGNKLTLEGKIMKHCVATRVYDVNTEKSAIFHIQGGEKGYTIQISYISQSNQYKLVLHEAKGFANSQLPKDTHQQVIDDIEAFNETLRVAYEPHNEEEYGLY